MVRLALLLVAAAVHDEPERYPLGATKAWEPGSNDFKKIDNAARLAKKNTPSGDLAWQLDDKTECYSGAEGLYSKVGAPRPRATRSRSRFPELSLRVEPSQRTVFCDAECLHSGEHSDEYCAGPWYCSTTRVCETYNRRHQGKIVHHEWPKCALIKSCAHYEQCFPTEEQFQAMGFHEGSNAEFQELPVPDHTELAKGNGVPLSSPFKYNVMGFQVRRPLLSFFFAHAAPPQVATRCCKNKNNYRSDVDMPCNAEDDFVDLTVDAPSDAPAARALGPLAVGVLLAAAVM